MKDDNDCGDEDSGVDVIDYYDVDDLNYDDDVDDRGNDYGGGYEDAAGDDEY